MFNMQMKRNQNSEIMKKHKNRKIKNEKYKLSKKTLTKKIKEQTLMNLENFLFSKKNNMNVAMPLNIGVYHVYFKHKN